MPANLTPQYLSAEQRYKAAHAPEEKLAALQEMLALLPKHKGTEKIRVTLTKRLSKLNDQAQQAQKKKGKTNPYDHVERQGAGQIALVGLPNSGKSTLVGALTQAQVEVADYPFSTLKPAVGMVDVGGVHVQLIDLPPLAEDYTERFVYNLIRNADRLCVLLDLSHDDPETTWLETLALLEAARLRLVGRATTEGFGPGTGVCKALILGTKADLAEATTLDSFENCFVEDYAYLTVDVHGPLDALKESLFDVLDLIRVYSKEPGKAADASPLTLKQGSTPLALAEAIHRELAAKLKYACLWRESAFDGQRVPRDHVLQDGDVVELHA